MILLLQKGFGAFAFISLTDASDLFVKRYVNTINK